MFYAASAGNPKTLRSLQFSSGFSFSPGKLTETRLNYILEKLKPTCHQHLCNLAHISPCPGDIWEIHGWNFNFLVLQEKLIFISLKLGFHALFYLNHDLTMMHKEQSMFLALNEWQEKVTIFPVSYNNGGGSFHNTLSW